MQNSAPFLTILLLILMAGFAVLFPFALEVHCIQKVCEHFRIYVLDDFRNQAVRVVRAPLVYLLCAAGDIVEIHIGHFCIIVFSYSRLVAVQQGIVLVYDDGIGDGQLGFLVHIGKLLQHGLAVFVDSNNLSGSVTQYAADFIGRLPLGSVQNHSKQELHAERGDDEISLSYPIHPVDKVECEVVALLGKLGRLGSQLQFFVRIVLRIIPSDFFAGDAPDKYGRHGRNKSEVFHYNTSVKIYRAKS